jgi:transcriptional regulator with XRE-family HTH domain
MATSKPGRDLVGALTALRRERGVSQAELARRLGVKPPHLSRIEHGTDLRLSTFVEIARELRAEPVLIRKEHLAAVRALLADLQSEVESVERPRFA